MRALLAIGALLGLAGCSPQQCNPSQAGFLAGIGCETSGSFATRSQYQQSQLAQENAAALQGRAAAQNEGARASQALLTRDQARQRLGAVDRQAAQLRARFDAARSRGGVDQVRLHEAQSELNALQRQRAGLQGGGTDVQLRALEEHQQRFRDQISGI